MGSAANGRQKPVKKSSLVKQVMMLAVFLLCAVGLVGIITDVIKDPGVLHDPGSLLVFAAAVAISLLWPPAR